MEAWKEPMGCWVSIIVLFGAAMFVLVIVWWLFNWLADYTDDITEW